MNDRFEFRFWDSWNEKMSYSRDFDCLTQFFKCYEDVKNGSNNPILMQSTGRRDKNGKMIFEGDIAAFTDKVEWYKGKYFAKVVIGEMTKSEALAEINSLPCEKRVIKLPDDYEWLLSSEIQQYWEVIGNINENQELLESV